MLKPTNRKIHAKIAMIAFGPIVMTVLTGMSYRSARGLFGMSKDDTRWLLRLHQMSYLSLDFIYPLVVGSLFLVMMSTGLSMARLKAMFCYQCEKYQHQVQDSREPYNASYNHNYLRRHSHLSSASQSSLHMNNTSSSSNTMSRTRHSRNKLHGSVTPTKRKGSEVGFIPSRWTVRSFHRFISRVLFVPLGTTIISGMLYCLARRWFGFSKESSKWLMKIHQGSYITDPVVYTFVIGSATMALLITGLMMTPWLQRKIHDMNHDPVRYSRMVRNISDGVFDLESPSGSEYSESDREYTHPHHHRSLSVSSVGAMGESSAMHNSISSSSNGSNGNSTSCAVGLGSSNSNTVTSSMCDEIKNVNSNSNSSSGDVGHSNNNNNSSSNCNRSSNSIGSSSSSVGNDSDV